MTRLKGTPNVHSIEEPEFHPFTLGSQAGEAKLIDKTCTWCGEKLFTFPWNHTKNMVTCLNEYCPAWKQPVSGR